MEKIKLPDVWLMGLPELDKQHQTLFDMANDCIEHLHGERQMVLQRFQDIFEYLKFHFEFEESLMVRMGYTGLTNHKFSHEAAIEKVQDVISSFDDDVNLREDSLQSIVHVIVSDIIVPDLAFKEVVQERLETGNSATK